MRAGVLARLRKEFGWMDCRPSRSAAPPIPLALADALLWAWPADKRQEKPESVAARLNGPDGPRQLISMVRELRLAYNRPDATLVLSLDQAEEILEAEQAEDWGAAP